MTVLVLGPVAIVAAIAAVATGAPWTAVAVMPLVFLLGYVVRDIDSR